VSRHELDRLSDHIEGDLAPDEFARVDAHLAECDSCALALRDLRETVALLRGLPDPVPPPEFAADVMQRVARDRGARGRVTPLFREIAQPRVAAALAAGLVALWFFHPLVIGRGGLLGPSSDPEGIRVVLGPAPVGGPVAGAEGEIRPRPSSPVPVTPIGFPRQAPTHLIAFEQRGLPPRIGQAAPRFGFYGSAAAEIPMRDLEAEVEALMADPDAFLARFERASAPSRRPFIGPIVDYSARRGGVSEVNRLLGRAAAPMVVPASTSR
jgi:hypothetical protein